MIGRIFSTLFFGVFAAFAVGFFAMKTWPMLHLWYQAQSWTAVPASVVTTDLKVNHGDDSTTYKAIAKYRYYYQGQNYIGTRVSLSSSSDNIGSYHQDTYQYLRKVQSSNQPLAVWVNPTKPEESIIDRKLRWGFLLFQSVFFILFGLIGFGGIAYFGFSEHATDDLPNADETKPWLSKKCWADKTILSNAKSAHKVILFFAVFWNLASIGAYFAIYDAIQGKAEPIAFIAIIFPIIGLFLIRWYFKLRYLWQKIGPTPLTMDPYPGSIGGQVGGHIDIRYSGIDRRKLLVKLSCLHNTKSGDDTDQSIVWQKKLLPAVDASYDGSRISFCFDVAAGMPESEEHNYPYHEWQVSLEGRLPDGLELDRQYEIPVFATGQTSSIRNIQAKVDNAETQRMHQQSVDLNMPLVQATDGSTEIYLPMGRYLGSALIGVIVGGVFAAIGFFLADAPAMLRWIFSFLGCLTLLASVYAMVNSLRVRIASEGIYTQRYLFGVRVKKSFMASYEFDKFDYKKTSSSQSGNKHTEYFEIVAKSKSGQRVTVAEGLEGRGQAQVAVEKLEQQLPFK